MAQYSKLLTRPGQGRRCLILDDWGLMKLSAETGRDLLEVLEKTDIGRARSTIGH